MQDILLRLESGRSALIPSIARPILERALLQPGLLPLSAGLGTAVLRKPRKPAELFAGGDSDRIDHSIWAWPLTEFLAFEPPVPARGFQGFWIWTERIEPCLAS